MATTALYYRNLAENSDKVYIASVDCGVVQFAWGRRGAALQTKTVGPLPDSRARALYFGKLAEKRAKGYRDGEPVTPIATVGFTPRRVA